MEIDFGRIMMQTAMQHSDKEALVNVERKRRFTFKELHLLTNKTCNVLKERFGLGTSDRYAAILRNDNIGLLNVWMFKSEASAGWLNFHDSLDVHMWQIDFLAPKLIFLETALLDTYYKFLHDRGIDIICMDPVPQNRSDVYYFWDLIKNASYEEPHVVFDRYDHVVLYKFNQGTTDKDKCAMYSINDCFFPAYGFYAHGENLIPQHIRHLHATPVTQSGLMFFLPVYLKGGTSVTMNSPNLNKFCNTIQNERITSTFLFLTDLCGLMECSNKQQYDLSTLDTVFCGVAPIEPDQLQQLQEKFGSIFVQVYSASKAFPPVSLLGKQEHTFETDEDFQRLTSIGRPCPQYEIKIVDKNGSEVRLCESGEAWLRGPGIHTKTGFLKVSEQADEEFTRDGWWKSGDVMLMDKKGYLYLVNRKKYDEAM